MFSKLKLSNFSLLVILNLLNLISYRIFIFSILISFIYFIYKDISFSNKEKLLLRVIPLNYFINNFMDLKSDSDIFWDMQNFIHYLKCNISEASHTYLFTRTKKACPETIGYGPLTEYLEIYNLNIWTTVIVFFIFFVLVVIAFLFKSNDLLLITVVTLISPGFHFLIFSLNTDIFVVTFLIYLLNKENFEINLFSLFIITLITQVKIYTIFLFFGYFFIYFLKKDIKSQLVIFFFIISNSILLIRHYLVDEYNIPAPISFTRTFGLYHDLQIVRDYIGYDELFVLIIVTFLTFVIGKNKIQGLSEKLLDTISIETSLKVLLIFPVCLVINLYQNWGYKFLFNSILIYIIFNYVTKPYKAFLIFTNIFSTMYYMIGWGFEDNFTNFILISLSKLSFYSYFLLSIYIFLKSTAKLIENQRLK